jgi:hypothetical protein
MGAIETWVDKIDLVVFGKRAELGQFKKKDRRNVLILLMGLCLAFITITIWFIINKLFYTTPAVVITDDFVFTPPSAEELQKMKKEFFGQTSDDFIRKIEDKIARKKTFSQSSYFFNWPDGKKMYFPPLTYRGIIEINPSIQARQESLGFPNLLTPYYVTTLKKKLHPMDEDYFIDNLGISAPTQLRLRRVLERVASNTTCGFKFALPNLYEVWYENFTNLWFLLIHTSGALIYCYSPLEVYWGKSHVMIYPYEMSEAFDFLIIFIQTYFKKMLVVNYQTDDDMSQGWEYFAVTALKSKGSPTAFVKFFKEEQPDIYHEMMLMNPNLFSHSVIKMALSYFYDHKKIIKDDSFGNVEYRLRNNIEGSRDYNYKFSWWLLFVFYRAIFLELDNETEVNEFLDFLRVHLYAKMFAEQYKPRIVNLIPPVDDKSWKHVVTWEKEMNKYTFKSEDEFKRSPRYVNVNRNE